MNKFQVGCAVSVALFALCACSDDEAVPSGSGGAGGDQASGSGAAPQDGTGASTAHMGGMGGQNIGVGGMGGVTAMPPTCEPPTTSGMGGMGGMMFTAPELGGSWTDAFGSEYSFGNVVTVGFAGFDPSTFYVTSFDDAEGWIVALNAQDNDYNPCAYSRFDWHEEGDTLFVCQTVFEAPTEQAAIATPPADDSNPSTSGCGGFPWSELSPK